MWYFDTIQLISHWFVAGWMERGSGHGHGVWLHATSCRGWGAVSVCAAAGGTELPWFLQEEVWDFSHRSRANVMLGGWLPTSQLIDMYDLAGSEVKQ